MKNANMSENPSGNAIATPGKSGMKNATQKQPSMDHSVRRFELQLPF
jgi:hypothetical protein